MAARAFDLGARRWGARALDRVAHAPTSSAVAERLHAFTLADKLDRIRTEGDIVAVGLPARSRSVVGRRLKMYRNGGTDLVAERFFQAGWRGFERPLPDVFVRTVEHHPGTVFDVGANTGLYSLLTRLTCTRSQVVAMEPFQPAIAALRRNLALNGITSGVELLEAAAADRTGSAVLYIPVDTGAIETSASLNGAFKEHIAEEVTVPVTTVDDVWRARQRPAVTVLKIDTEGTEEQVLEGARDMIDTSRPVSFCEVLPRAAMASLTALADELDLVDVRLRPDRAIVGGPIEFDADAWNHALVPRERMGDFEVVLHRCDLDVVPG